MVKQQVWMELALRLLKSGSPVLSIYLAKIFNLSLKLGSVPKCWKTKRVSPLYKGDLKTDPSNFRPISILPIPMKIFEKIVHDQVSEFIKESKFLSDRQSGFRKLFSTNTAILDVSDYILEQLDNKKYVDAVLIDLKKAFDTVLTTKFCSKNYGVMVSKTKFLTGLCRIYLLGSNCLL